MKITSQKSSKLQIVKYTTYPIKFSIVFLFKRIKPRRFFCKHLRFVSTKDPKLNFLLAFRVCSEIEIIRNDEEVNDTATAAIGMQVRTINPLSTSNTSSLRPYTDIIAQTAMMTK